MLKSKTHLWLKIILVVIGLAILTLAFIVVRPDSYWPHKRLVIRAPFDLNDPPSTLIPMGEKVYHPDAPSGHPGIDFQWDHKDVNILASADGKISSIKQTPEHFNNWDIEISSWPYVIRYKELQDYDSSLKKGSPVKAGQLLGHPTHPDDGETTRGIQLHWEFASASLIRDRFCPMTYFDEASRQVIETVWAKSTWQHKNQYPNLCNDDYFNKTD